MKSWKKIAVFLVVLLGAAIPSWLFWPDQAPQEVPVSTKVDELLSGQSGIDALPKKDIESEDKPVIPPVAEDNTPPETKRVIPAKAMLSVPFAPQAPFSNWELPYKEACEEASVIMVNRFYRGEKSIEQEDVKAAIDAMVAWAIEPMQGKIDTDVATTAKYFTEYLEYSPSRVTIINEPTIEDIKAVVAAGYPVIVPAAGRDLGNVNFRNPGPLYHMLVIVGYDEDEFITNDPGTRNGEGYRYKQQVLYDAIHDLTPVLENIRQGRKVMMVVKPQV